MAKLKKTKSELKAQREALDRYHRFLPTLELKKEQLQREVRQAEARLSAVQAQERESWSNLLTWARVLPAYPGVTRFLGVQKVDLGSANVAGVTVPVFEAVVFADVVIDFFSTPSWLELAVRALRDVARLRIEAVVLERQSDLLGEELRITSQRVNLFEKVMIPRTQDAIRVIQIALGDAQTAGVIRAKIAKGKSHELISGATGG